MRSGDFGKIRNTFKQLMRHYVHALFEERLQPKCIHGAYVTGEELLTYVKAYTTVFCEAKAFPECKTLLNAVAVSPSNEFVVANRPLTCILLIVFCSDIFSAFLLWLIECNVTGCQQSQRV